MMMETLKNIFSLVRPEMDVSSITRDTHLTQFSGMEHFETVGDVCDYIAERIRENNEPAACSHP